MLEVHNILKILRAEGINVEYMYAYVRHTGQDAVMIFRFDNISGAIEVLNKNDVAVIDGERLYSM